MAIKVIVLAVIVISNYQCQFARADTSGELVDKVKREAPQGWKLIALRYSKLQYTASIEYSVKMSNGKANRLACEVRCCQNGNCASIVGSLDLNFKDMTEKKAVCINSKYGFDVTDRLNNGSWRYDRSVAKDEIGYTKLFANWLLTVQPATSIDNPNYVALSDFILDPDTTIDSAEDIAGIVKVRYSTKQKLRNGIFDLDSSNNWRVVGYAFQRQNSNFSSTTTNTYGVAETADFVVKMDCETTALHGATHTIISFHDFGECTDPESDFTLTKYNLPEPTGVEWNKPTPRYQYWLIAFACFAILAIACKIVIWKVRFNLTAAADPKRE